MARVWVTGSGGFLGRQIEVALRRLGADPVAPCASSRPDLLDPAARSRAVDAARAEILVHAAWVTATGTYWNSPLNADWVAATAALVRAFAAAGGRRIVFVGSCAEYDWTVPGHEPWRETRRCVPRTVYGAAKHASWADIAAFTLVAGMSAVNARVFIPIGPHEAATRLLPSLIRTASGAGPLAVGPAALTRDFVDVRDAGAAIAHLALADVQGAVNVGSGRPTRLDTLVRLAAGDAPGVRLGGRPLSASEPAWMVADIDRLRQSTGFVPRYPLAETVAAARSYWHDQRVAA